MSVTQRDATSALWRNRDYLLLWGGQSLSDIGGAVSELAFPLLVLLVTHSPAQAGFVSALRALPALFMTLPAGALVDRWDRKRIMLVCDSGRALSLASIPVAFAFGLLTIWQLYIAAGLEGALMVVFQLARTAAVAQVVTPSRYSDAVAQDEVVEGVTALVGPSLSGALYTLGAMIPFLTDVVSYSVSLVSLALIRTPFQADRVPTSQRLRTDIVSGIRWVRRQPFILTMTLMMGAGAFVNPSSGLITIILAQRAGAPTWVIGLIFAAGGAGAILGSWIASRFTHRLTVGQSILVSRCYFALSWPFYALTPVPFALGALNFGEGFVDPIEDIPYFSHRLRLIPDALKGRVISACRLVPGVMRPLGLALTGALIQRIGIFPTIWLLWAWLMLATTILVAVPYVRRERGV